MSFNSTSKIISTYVSASYYVSGSYGVVLPESSKVLFKSDIDSKIQKTKNQINYLSNSVSHKNTSGGKRFRGRQISIRNQIDYAKERLALLVSAKKFKLDNAPVFKKLDPLVVANTTSRVGISILRNQECPSFLLTNPMSYGETTKSSFCGGRTFTVVK